LYETCGSNNSPFSNGCSASLPPFFLSYLFWPFSPVSWLATFRFYLGRPSSPFVFFSFSAGTILGLSFSPHHGFWCLPRRPETFPDGAFFVETCFPLFFSPGSPSSFFLATVHRRDGAFFERMFFFFLACSLFFYTVRDRGFFQSFAFFFFCETKFFFFRAKGMTLFFSLAWQLVTALFFVIDPRLFFFSDAGKIFFYGYYTTRSPRGFSLVGKNIFLFNPPPCQGMAWFSLIQPFSRKGSMVRSRFFLLLPGICVWGHHFSPVFCVRFPSPFSHWLLGIKR